MKTASRVLVSLAVSLMVASVYATTYIVPSDGELVEAADAIVVATGVSSRSVEIDGNIWTEYQLAVEESIKGQLVRSQLVTVTEPGGLIGNRAHTVPGVPVYDIGETSLVFLAKQGSRWQTWGLGLGKFERVAGTPSVLVRGTDGHDINGTDVAGEPHIELVRLEKEFLQYVRARARGENPRVDYLADAAAVESLKQALEDVGIQSHPVGAPYLQLLGGVASHWSPPRYTMLVNANGYPNANADVDNARGVWNSAYGTPIAISRGGATTAGAANDGQNVIMFRAATPGGVAGFANIYGSPGTITSADIRISAGQESVLPHEMGHSLGFRHSDCSAGTPCSNIALMQPNNPGSSLRAWDRLAITAVYGNGPQCTPPTLSTQPSNETITQGSSATLVARIGAEGIYPATYQWFLAPAGDRTYPVGSGGSVQPAAGGSGNPAISLTVSPSSTTSYWVHISNGCGSSVSSNAATVTVTTSSCTPVAITAQPQSQNVGSGQQATFSVTATGTGPLTYLWYEMGLFGGSPAPGVNNQATYTTPALSANTSYYVVVSNSCSSVTSATANVTVGGGGCVAPAIVNQPSSAIVNSGGSATLTVGATGTPPLQYQWYRGNSGDTSNPFPGATGSSFATGPLTQTTNIWVRVSNSCNFVNSTTATISVGCSLAAPALAVPANAQSGASYSAQLGPTTGAIAHEIQEATNPDFSNATTRTETGGTSTFVHTVAPPNPVAYYYRARAIVSCNGINTNTAYSNVARTVVQPPTVPQVPPTSGIDIAVPVGTTQPTSFQFILPAPAGLASAPYAATTDVPFMTVSPGTGTAPATLTVTVNTASLPEGTNTGTVLVTFTTPKTFEAQATSSAAVPVNVSSTTAAAPVPKSGFPPDNALIIPAVAHADGLNAQFVSDIRIANTFGQLLKYKLTYTPSNTDGTKAGQQTTVNIGAGATTAMNDIVKNWFGGGALPGESSKGVLEIRPENYNGKIDGDARSAYSTVASSRTYAKTSAGTFGQFIPAIPFGRFVGKTTDQNQPATLSLQQIAQSAQYRTNLGLVEASGQPATVRIRVFNNAGQQLGEFNEVLGPAEFKQFDQYLASKNITLTDGRLQIDVTSDTGRVIAYASVVDNGTADPLLVEATRVLNTKSRRFVVPGMARTTANGANWRSDLRVFNPTSAPITATLTYLPQGNPGGAQSLQRTIQPGQILAMDNVVETTFGTSGAGAIHVDTANESPLIVTARTYDQQPTGTYGQFVPAVTSADAVGAGERSLQVLQVEHSDQFRTNVGLVEVSGQPVTVRITAIIPQRATAPIITRQLAGNEFVQLNSILPNFMAVTGAAYNVRLTMEVVGGTGRLASYASVIDNATQDPTYIPAQ